MRKFCWSMLLLVPVVAQAHPGHAHDTGVLAGALHPFTGLDHLAGILAAGVLMGWLPSAARWPVCGGFLGLLGITHVLWIAPGAGAGFVPALLLMSGILVAAGMTATRWIPRLITAGAARSRT